MNNNRGFVLMGFCLFLPLLIVLFLGSHFILWFSSQKQNWENICHEHVLKSQQALVQGNQQILALNPIAEGYILAHKRLNKLIRTGKPPIVAAALALKAIVTGLQVKLQAKQTLLKESHHTLARSYLYILRQRFYSHVKQMARSLGSKSQGYGHIKVYFKRSKLQPKKRSIAPPYRRPLTIQRTQAHRVQYFVPINHLLPHWIKQYFSFRGSWKGECWSHPHQVKGGKHWLASIGKGNHSLNF